MESNISLYQAVKNTAEQYPENNALLFMGKNVKYHELVKKVDSFASGLKDIGIKQGDVVTMALPNVFEAVYSLYAVNKLGVIAHMVHPVTPVKQMQKFIKTTGSKTLIVMDTFYDHYAKLLDDGVRMILVNPTSEFGLIKQLGYKVINRKKLKNIQYNEKLMKFDSIYSDNQVEPAVTDPKMTSTYLHSGGTSGEPKTIELSNYAINFLASKFSYIMGVDDFTNKHMLAVLPLFHGFGLCMGVHGILRFGGTDTLMPKFNVEEAIKLIKNNQINYLIGVPSLFEALLHHPEFSNPNIKNLDQAFVGGDYVALDLKNRFDRAMEKVGSQARLLEGYGLTEVVTVCSVNTLRDHNQSSVGKTLPDLEMGIVDMETHEFLPENQDGIIVVSGPTMMNGYLKDPEATNETILKKKNKKWIMTGDLGFIDENGYVHFKQRLKRIIKVSGIPVLPAEIENLLMSYDSIMEVAAIGIPDEIKGNMVKLFVVFAKDKPKINNDKLKDIIKLNLGNYAVPKEIVELDVLPKTDIGKTNVLALEKM